VAVPTKARVRETYERIAASFAPTRREPWPEVVAFVDSLSSGSRVLDVGCGNGRHMTALAERGHAVIGVDFSRRLLSLGREAAMAKNWASRVEWIEADADALPLRADAFDACICIAVLHHLPRREDRIAALREVRRVLAAGGRAFVSVWALDQPRFRDAVEKRRSMEPSSGGDTTVPWTLPDGTTVERFYHLFQEGELEPLIIESGLQVETFFRRTGNYFCTARKHG